MVKISLPVGWSSCRQPWSVGGPPALLILIEWSPDLLLFLAYPELNPLALKAYEEVPALALLYSPTLTLQLLAKGIENSVSAPICVAELPWTHHPLHQRIALPTRLLLPALMVR
jgi:hypothetical protein